MENLCPKDGTPLQLTHLTYIEECPNCGYYFDVAHDKEVEREWVYGDGYPNDDEDFVSDEEYAELEAAAFGGHKDVWIDVDGQPQRVFGDPNMSEETKQALAGLIKSATEAVERGDFDNDEEEG